MTKTQGPFERLGWSATNKNGWRGWARIKDERLTVQADHRLCKTLDQKRQLFITRARWPIGECPEP